MTVCRYWQSGNCRFGNSCKFDHHMGGGGQGDENNIMTTLVSTAKVDMETWEKSNQWLFSCYSPAKETASFPGILDWSPEELRYDAYVANSTNKVDEYRQKIKSMTDEYLNKRKALANPSEQIKGVLLKIYKKEQLGNISNDIFSNNLVRNSAFQNNSSIFGGSSNVQSSSNSIFGGKSSAASIFGGSQNQQSSAFGGQSQSSASIFGGSQNQQSSPFGGAAQSSSSIFGGSQNQPAFGEAAQNQSSIFGGQSSSVFSNNQQQPQSVFGGSNQNTAIIKPATSGGPFGAQNTSAPAFGQPANFGESKSIFGQSQNASTSVFGNSNAQSVFQTNQTAFGNQPANTSTTFGGNPTQPVASPFGTQVSNNAPTTPNPFGGGNQETKQPSLFNTAPNSSPFSSNTQQGQISNTAGASPFAPATPFTNEQSQNVNLFGNDSVPKQDSFSSTQSTGGKKVGLFGKVEEELYDPSKYTKKEDLTAEEISQFTAEVFKLGFIPQRPPCQEMCA